MARHGFRQLHADSQAAPERAPRTIMTAVHPLTILNLNASRSRASRKTRRRPQARECRASHWRPFRELDAHPSFPPNVAPTLAVTLSGVYCTVVVVPLTPSVRPSVHARHEPIPRPRRVREAVQGPDAAARGRPEGQGARRHECPAKERGVLPRGVLQGLQWCVSFSIQVDEGNV